MKKLKETKNYSIKKVKRNYAGSYAIFFNGKQSEDQYNSDTVRYFNTMSDEKFEEIAKPLNYLTIIKPED